MSLAIVYSRAQQGVAAPLITIETHLSNGLPGLSIVGLPEAAVKESKDRVRSAILNAHFEFPARRITINLAPADIPKQGSRFDLAIALGILAASGQVESERLAQLEFIGELALTGELRPVSGVLPAAMHTARAKRSLIVAQANADEAALVQDGTVYGANHLLEVCAFLQGRAPLAAASPPRTEASAPYPDLAEVVGQSQAKRALEIAAAGGHNLIMVGPPGTGKTMLASRLPGILPAMSDREALQQAAVLSLANGHHQVAKQWRQRSFRAPHHTASAVALVGGGNPPKPGEISLAHHGVLFLDELPEFQRKVLEVLREPLEKGEIAISRASQQVTYPARFLLVSAMNPCPCGYYGDSEQSCRCTPDQIRRYRSKISGPLLDRIDLQLTVGRLPRGSLTQPAPAQESSAQIRQRVEVARQRQLGRQGCANSALNNPGLQQHCALGSAEQQLLEQAMERLKLSARAFYRIIKVARTIADLEQTETISRQHLAEALSYRNLDRPPA